MLDASEAGAPTCPAGAKTGSKSGGSVTAPGGTNVIVRVPKNYDPTTAYPFLMVFDPAGADGPEVHRQLSLMFDPTDPAVTRKRGRWELGPAKGDELRPGDHEVLPPRERPSRRLYIIGRHSDTKCSGGRFSPPSGMGRGMGAIVTGAASGIGRAIAERLSTEGVDVLAADLGLDAAAVARFGALLAGHRERGGVVVAATHLPLPMAGAAELRLGAGTA